MSEPAGCVGAGRHVCQEGVQVPVHHRGMHPEIPETKILDNPYQYTDFRSGETHGG